MKWSDVVSDPRYGQLDDGGKRDLKQKFFNETVGGDPRWDSLDEDSKASIQSRMMNDWAAEEAKLTPKPSLMDRLGWNKGKDIKPLEGDTSAVFNSGVPSENQERINAPGSVMHGAIAQSDAETRPSGLPNAGPLSAAGAERLKNTTPRSDQTILRKAKESIAQKQQRDKAIYEDKGLPSDSSLNDLQVTGAGSRAAIAEGRDLGDVYQDTAAQLGEGVVNTLKAPVDLVAPESGVAQTMNRGADWLRDQQSDYTKAKIIEAERTIHEAAKNGEWEAFKAALSEYMTDPALAARFTLTNVASMVPAFAAGKAAQMFSAAKGLSAAKTAAMTTGALAGTNALLNAGGARGEAYQTIKQELLRQGMSEDEADKLALEKSVNPALWGAGAGALGGAFGVEGVLLGAGKSAAAAVGRAAATRAGVGAIAKELGTEQLEEQAPHMATNAELGKDLTAGVGNVAAQTLMGAGPLSLMGGASAYQDARGGREGQFARELQDLVDSSSFDQRGIDVAAVASTLRPEHQQTFVSEMTRILRSPEQKDMTLAGIPLSTMSDEDLDKHLNSPTLDSRAKAKLAAEKQRRVQQSGQETTQEASQPSNQLPPDPVEYLRNTTADDLIADLVSRNDPQYAAALISHAGSPRVVSMIIDDVRAVNPDLANQIAAKLGGQQSAPAANNGYEQNLGDGILNDLGVSNEAVAGAGPQAEGNIEGGGTGVVTTEAAGDAAGLAGASMGAADHLGNANSSNGALNEKSQTASPVNGQALASNVENDQAATQGLRSPALPTSPTLTEEEEKIIEAVGTLSGVQARLFGSASAHEDSSGQFTKSRGAEVNRNAGSMALSVLLHEVKHGTDAMRESDAGVAAAIGSLDGIILEEAKNLGVYLHTDAGLIKFAREYHPGLVSQRFIDALRHGGATDAQIVDEILKNLDGEYAGPNGRALLRGELTNDVFANAASSPGFMTRVAEKLAKKNLGALSNVVKLLDNAITKLKQLRKQEGFKGISEAIAKLERVRNEAANVYSAVIERNNRLGKYSEKELGLIAKTHPDQDMRDAAMAIIENTAAQQQTTGQQIKQELQKAKSKKLKPSGNILNDLKVLGVDPNLLSRVYKNGASALESVNDLGEVAERLRSPEFGYVFDDVNNDPAQGLADFLQRVASGDASPLNAQRLEAEYEKEQKSKHKEYVNTKAKELGLKGIGGRRTLEVVEADIAKLEEKATDQAIVISNDVADELTTTEIDEAESMRLMGFSEDEIKAELEKVRTNSEASRTTSEGSASNSSSSGSSEEGEKYSPSRAGEGQQEFSLNGQTSAEVKAQEAKRLAEEKAKDKEPAGNKVKADQIDLFNPQGGLFSLNRTINVDGVDRPTTNSEGKPIHYTEEGIRNFWRWIDGTNEQRVVRATGKGGDATGVSGSAERNPHVAEYAFDGQGRPRVFFHGTSSSFDSFQLSHKDRKDHGWLGRGVYVTSDKDLSTFYAFDKRGNAEPNLMPLYIAIHNPLIADANTKALFRDAPKQAIDSWTDKMIAKGFDSAILEFSDGHTEIVVFNNTAVKSETGNGGEFSPENADLRLSPNRLIETPAFKQFSNNAPFVSSENADTYPFKTGEKVAVEAYHGTARPDRVGTVFQKKRATSGPMAFFTSEPVLASSYAQGKQDTSLAYEDGDYANWFKVKFPGDRSSTDIVRAWHRLDGDTKAKIREVAPTLRLSDDAESVVSEEGNTSGNGSYDYNLETSARKSYTKQGNPIEAMVEDWLNSGNLFDNEELFLKVLQKAGFPTKLVEYDAPTLSLPFVYKTYIAMQNPLVTSDIPQSLKDALNEAAKRDRSRAQTGGADMWDKNTKTLREWVALFNEPNNEYVWTSIPDKVTDVLKAQGFDGIIDWSGKGGGATHPVYIPFNETQVKSAIGNKGKFDPTKKDIRFSPTRTIVDAIPESKRSQIAKSVGSEFKKLVNANSFQLKTLQSHESLADTFKTVEDLAGHTVKPMDKSHPKARNAADSQWIIKSPDGREAYLYKFGNDLQVDVSGLKSKESRGTAVYQAVGVWADKRGYIFEGDSQGATLAGIVRRGENMISNILRTKTSYHWKPHDLQVNPQNNPSAKKLGVRGVRWATGEADQNLGELLISSYNTVIKVLPEIAGIRANEFGEYENDNAEFDFTADQTVYDVPAFNRLADAATERLKAYRKDGEDATSPIIGVATIKRAIVTQDLLRRGLGQSGIPVLRGTLGEGSGSDVRSGVGSLDKALYSPRRSPLGFYSQLSRAVEQAPDRVFGPAQQVKLWLASNTSKLGVKAEEIQWTGINDWLDLQGNNKVTKTDVLNYLEQNGVDEQNPAPNLKKPEHIKELALHLYKDGLSSVAVASQLGLGETTVLRWVKNSGLTRTTSESKGVTQEKIEAAVRAYSEGNSVAKSAEIGGIGSSTLHRVLVARGESRRLEDVNNTPEDVKKNALDLYASGMTTYEAAAAVGVDQGSVSKWAREAGISRGYSGAQALRVANGRLTGYGIKAEFNSEKSGRAVRADSIYELARFHQLEADNDVESFGRSSDRIPYGDGRHYVPDIEINYIDGRIEVEEVKPEFSRNSANVLEKESAAKEYYAKNGIGYRVVTERDIGRENFDKINPDTDVAGKDIKRAKGALATARWILNQPGFSITPSMKEKVSEGLPLFSPARSLTPPAETKAQAFQRSAQDKFNRFKVVQDWLDKSGTKITEQNNVYRAEERWHGRVATRLEDFREKVLKPQIEAIQKAGFTMQDVADFLEAQHTAEANAQIRKLTNDPKATAAGITDQEAAQYLSTASPKLKQVANDFRKITDMTRQKLLQAGIIDKDTLSAWDKAYKHYVPLKGGDEDTKTGTGPGQSVNGKQKRRLGHGKREEHVVENIIRDYERSVILAEKNLVGQHLIRLAIDAGNPDLITVDKPEKRKVLMPGKATYVVEYNGSRMASFDSQSDAGKFVAFMGKAGMTIKKVQGDPNVQLMAAPMLQENEAQVYVNGHAIRVQINDPILAEAYKNLGVEQMGMILRAGRTLNNYLSAAYTGYNPEFILVNMARDFTGGMVNLTGKYGMTMAARTLINYPRAFGEILAYSFTGNASKDVASYRENGGSTGAGYLGDIERIGKDVQSAYDQYAGAMEAFQKGKPFKAVKVASKKLVGAILGWINHMNAASENAMRLAAFKAIRGATGSVNEAAHAAKNVTVNFNRKGNAGPQLGALYLFANPSIQGTKQLLETLATGEHKAQSWALVATMASLAALAAAQFSDDEWDEIPDSEKDRNLLIRTGEDSRIAIPIPYGYGFFFGLGNAVVDGSQKKDLSKVATHIASSFFEHFSPFGNPVMSPITMLPTAIKMGMEPALNMNDFGNTIVPESPYNRTQADHTKMYRGTKGTGYDKFAAYINGITGGTSHTEGKISVSPETYKYWVSTLTGGAGRFATDLVGLGTMMANGADPELHEIPILRKFYKEDRITGKRSAYFEASKEAEEALAKYKAAVKAGDLEGAEKTGEKSNLFPIAKLAKSYQKRIKEVRDLQVQIQQDENKTLAERKLAIKLLEVEEAKFYDSLLSEYRQVK